MNNLKRKILALSVAAGIFATAAPMSFATDLGDVNEDGSINSADALAVLQYAIGSAPTKFNSAFADLNADSQINSADALKILQISVGMITPPDVKSPLDYDKAEIVNYYNTSLQKSYNAEKVKIDKKTNVTVKIDTLSVSSLMGMANSLIEKYAVPTSATQDFANGKATDGTTAEAFLVPTALEADGAKDAVVTKTDNGYKVVITLVEEKVDHIKAPKYNTQASLPLAGIQDAISSFGATVTKCNLDYQGTILTAEIDKDGNVLSLNHTMPLKIDGAGKYSFFSVSGSGHGEYTLDATFTY